MRTPDGFGTMTFEAEKQLLKDKDFPSVRRQETLDQSRAQSPRISWSW